MPNAQKTLSQPRSIGWPPVSGTIELPEDCEPEEPELEEPEPEPAGAVAVGAGEVGEGEVGVTGVLEALTVTRKLPGVLLPASSVAVQLTVVVPTGKTEPEAGEQFSEGEAAIESLAETE